MRIGNIEITRINNPDISIWATITMHYNDHVSYSFDVRSKDDLLNLEYAIKVLKRDVKLD